LKERVDKVSEWIEEQIKLIKSPPEDVDGYVKQVQAIEFIDDNFMDQKDILDIENQKYTVALDEELIGREDKVKHNINRAYALSS
jgi:Asp-tRNA(Asn)/Glu-tRNA(Gln) amidotransferase C subunit